MVLLSKQVVARSPKCLRPRAANRKKNEPALSQLSEEDAAPGNPVLIPLLSKSGITCYLGIATNHSFKRGRHFQIVSPQRCAVTKTNQEICQVFDTCQVRRLADLRIRIHELSASVFSTCSFFNG
jgi:hypothetical protein